MPSSLRQMLTLLEKEKDVLHIHASVDPFLEIPEIHRRIIDQEGPVLFFHNVKNSSFPVVTNLFGSSKRVEKIFSTVPRDLFSQATELLSSPINIKNLWLKRSLLKRLMSLGLKKKMLFPLKKMENVDLYKIPFLTSWPEDGGPFLTLPLVYTEHPSTNIPNLGMYRMQRFDSHTMGLHFQIQKGGGMHLFDAEKHNQNLPVNVFLSGNPFLILSAIAPLPENVSELILCSFLQQNKLKFSKQSYHPYPFLHDVEFIFSGYSPAHIRKPEGPFGDHYGYYSLTHDFPIFKCTNIYHQKHAIYPATIVGKPKQEDFYLGDLLQEYFKPLIKLTMPSIFDIKTYGETGFHSLTAAITKERYWRECLTTAFRILGEGQLSLTKFLFITDQQDINLNNFADVLETILSRIRPKKDVFIFSETSMDTLDYTGASLNQGSKAVFLGIGKQLRELPSQYKGTSLTHVSDIKPFCPGCLVLEASHHISLLPLFQNKELQKWPLIILTDNLEQTLKNHTQFLWHIFTRCSPNDLYLSSQESSNEFPMILNAFMKTTYPKEVVVDEKTHHLVSSRWKEYFI